METGAKIKEARTTAGLSQAALAEAALVVSASDISKAERGIKELSSEQLDAIAKVLGVAPESFMEAEPAYAPDEPSVSDQELLALFREADTGKQKMVVSALKGAEENPDLAYLLAGILRNNDAGALLNAVKTLVLGANVGELLGNVKSFLGSINGSGVKNSIIGMFANVAGGYANNGFSEDPAAQNSESQKGTEISAPLLAFTYFYAATFYILLLSFYFWLWRKDLKPEI